MCNEREQLIAYLYDEASPTERKAMDAHLTACETCRDELRAFRDVRQDLLAFDVPEHESVWKPFVAARPQPVWRQMPAWSLAAAATVMFAIGGAGGFAGRVIASEYQSRATASQMNQPTQVAAIEPSEPQVGPQHDARPAVQPTAVTPGASLDDVRALQARLDQLERIASARTVATTPVSMSALSDAATMAKIEQLIRESEGRSNKRLSQQIFNIVGELNSQRLVDRSTLEQKINETQAQINGTMLQVMNRRSPEKER